MLNKHFTRNESKKATLNQRKTQSRTQQGATIKRATKLATHTEPSKFNDAQFVAEYRRAAWQRDSAMGRWTVPGLLDHRPRVLQLRPES